MDSSKKKRNSKSIVSKSLDTAGDGFPVGAPADKTKLEVRFIESQKDLSKSRKKLLNKILSEPHETFFLSSREMAKRYGVDSSTIVRTIQAMGYEKFGDFVNDLRNHFVTRITPYSAMKVATQRKGRVVDHVHRSIDQDLANLTALKSEIDAEKLSKLAKDIHLTRRVVVLGIDFAESLASSLAYGLMRAGYDAEAPVGGSGVVQNKVRVMTRKDMLIAFSFGPCLRETVDAVRRARRQGVPTFGITDSAKSPLARNCDDHMITSITRTSFLDSYVAPVAAINAILGACAHSQPKRALELLSQVEKEDKASGRWCEDDD